MLAILTQKNSFVGREYAGNLLKNKINCYLIQIGKETKNKIEIERSGRNWRPITILNLKKKGLKIYNFKKFNKAFKNFIKKKKIVLGIQGGVGIINKKTIECFKKGIINCHPGDIPLYRGASSPEYQLINKKPVKVSFHYINEKIDAGHIIYKTNLKLNYKSYSLMRSTIYKEIAKELVYVLSNLNNFKKKKISLKNSSIRPYIGKKKIDHLKKHWGYYSNLK